MVTVGAAAWAGTTAASCAAIAAPPITATTAARRQALNMLNMVPLLLSVDLPRRPSRPLCRLADMAARSNVTESLSADHTGQPTGTTTGAPTGLAMWEGVIAVSYLAGCCPFRA